MKDFAIRRYGPLLAGLILLPVAAMCDARVAGYVHAHHLRAALKASEIAKVIKWPGDFRFTLVVAAIIVAINLSRWRGAVMLLISGVLAGLLYTLVKWSVGRTRPFSPENAPVPAFEFHPFHRGLAGLWKADNQAFPSGHACLAFATAAALSEVFPRGWPLFYLLAAMVGAERVLENAHYPSDVMAGAVFGIFAAMMARKYLQRLFPDDRDSLGFSPRVRHDTVG